MNSLFQWLFGSEGFMPHGMCYLWRPDVLWLNVGSDALIAASYFAIPAVLGHFTRRRRHELPFPWIPYLFASFIFLCGTTHVMGIWTVWHPNYRLDGFIKLATGIVSFTTAIALLWVMPRAITLRTATQLQREVDERTTDLRAANERLRAEIAARERTELELRESEQRFRRIADVMPNVVYVSKPGGGTEYINARWKEYTGYDDADLDALSALVPGDELDRVREAMTTAARQKQTYSCELRIKRASDGSYRWFLTQGAPVLDERGEVFRWVGSTVDIDDQKRAEQELRAADRQKDEFLAVLAHELRNPLAPIKNALSIFERAKLDDATLNKARAIMQRQITQLTRLVDDLVDVSRIRMNRIELRREKVDLRHAVQNAVEVAQPLVNATEQTLAVEIPAEPVYVDGDLARLTQVIGNLLSNSSKYSPPRTAISIGIRALPEVAEIVISDQGSGIAPEDLPRIFDLFVQVGAVEYKTNGGLGIGLALVRRLVQLHGGAVSAASEGLGRGSTFTVRIPRHRDDADT